MTGVNIWQVSAYLTGANIYDRCQHTWQVSAYMTGVGIHDQEIVMVQHTS